MEQNQHLSQYRKFALNFPDIYLQYKRLRLVCYPQTCQPVQ
jgi:hypothetical protein